jgi:endonuclease YncB( thermonuclease family)
MIKLGIKSKILLISLLFLSLISCKRERSSNSEKIADTSADFGVGTQGEFKVIGIVDGDTYDILVDKTKIRIRMDAIDAPERGMPYYKVAKRHLSDLIFGKFPTIEITDVDHHGRYIAKTIIDDLDVSGDMIKSGLAWHYKEHNDNKEYANYEIEARNNSLGLWLDKNPYKPWEIRKLHREGVSTKNLFENKVD